MAPNAPSPMPRILEWLCCVAAGLLLNVTLNVSVPAPIGASPPRGAARTAPRRARHLAAAPALQPPRAPAAPRRRARVPRARGRRRASPVAI
jgi:hypothetical protein